MNQSEYEFLKGLDQNPVKIGDEHNSLAIDGLIMDIDGHVALTNLGKIAIKDYEDYAALNKTESSKLPDPSEAAQKLQENPVPKNEATAEKQSLPTKIKEAAKKILPKKKK